MGNNVSDLMSTSKEDIATYIGTIADGRFAQYSDAIKSNFIDGPTVEAAMLPGAEYDMVSMMKDIGITNRLSQTQIIGATLKILKSWEEKKKAVVTSDFTSWCCQICTLENVNEFLVCAACSSPKKAESQSSSVFSFGGATKQGGGSVHSDESLYQQMVSLQENVDEVNLHSSENPSTSYTCCLCDDCTTADNGPQFIYDCPEKHTVCNDCFQGAFQSDLNANGGMGDLAKCAMCQGTSPYRLSIEEVSRRYLRSSDEYRKYADILTIMHFNQCQDYIDCPSPDCSGKMYIPDLANLSANAKGSAGDGDGENLLQRTPSHTGGSRGDFRVECRTCNSDFCLGCKRPFHNRLSCSQVSVVADSWFRWVKIDSITYKNQLKKQQEVVQEKYTSAVQERERELAIIENNYQALKQDEELKARSMRLCPHCGVAFQKTDGCDSMTCGKDASDKGGKTHYIKGCFKRFNMNDSLPYTAGIEEKRGLPNELKDLQIEEIEETRHYIDCDKEFSRTCQCCCQPIVGPRFTCVNCLTGLDVCMTCCDFIIANNTTARGPDPTSSSSKGGNMEAAAMHSRQHIFIVYLEPTFPNRLQPPF